MKKRKRSEAIERIENNCLLMLSIAFYCIPFSTSFFPKNNPTNALNLNNTLTTII